MKDKRATNCAANPFWMAKLCIGMELTIQTIVVVKVM
jgi:hypothetical protein